MLVVRAALAGKSLPASQRVLALRQHARAGAASRYALGAGGVGAAHPAPAASLTSASRYALGARRTALRAEGAARLCAGRRSRWLPSPPRATRSAPMAWALRARALHVFPPDNAPRCLLVVGMSKTSCALR